jgi:hypothetical protein
MQHFLRLLTTILLVSATQPAIAGSSAHWWGNNPGSAVGRDDRCLQQSGQGVAIEIPCWIQWDNKHNQNDNMNGNGNHNVNARDTTNGSANDVCDYYTDYFEECEG